MHLSKQQPIDHSTPYRYSLAQCIGHAFTSSCGVDYDASIVPISRQPHKLSDKYLDHDSHEPTRPPDNVQYLYIQTPCTEAPLSPVSVRALKVGTSSLPLWRDIPTTATLIRNKGQTVFGGDVLDKERVMVNGM